MYDTRKRLKYYYYNNFLPIFVYAPLAGIITGIFVFLFKFCADFVYEKSAILFSLVRENPAYIPVFFVALLILSLLITLIIKYNPDIKGGGIPRSEGILRGLLTFKWLRTAIGTFVCSLLGFFSGLPLGAEGPSVMLGTAIGQGTSKIARSNPALSRYLMTGAAGAGFAISTGAPFTGIIFIIEEIHKRFSFFILTMAMSTVIFGYYTAELLMGITGTELQFLELAPMSALPYARLWISILVGIAAGIAAVVFNQLMYFADKVYGIKFKNLPRFIKVASAVVLTGGLGLLLEGLPGSGHDVIESIINDGITIKLIFMLFLLKIITIVMSANSGATGGMFVPVLVVGALLGGLMRNILGYSGSEYGAIIVCIGICAFLGAVMHAPITAVVFVIEATGQFNGAMFYVTAVFISVCVTSLFNTHSLNDTLLEKILRQKHEGIKPSLIIIKAVVQENSFAVDKRTKDLLWPINCIVRTVVRKDMPTSEAKMVNGGDKMFHIGDKLVIQAQTYDQNATIKELCHLLGEQNIECICAENKALAE